MRCGKGQRALLHLFVLIGVHQIPVDVLDLRDGGNHLRAKGQIGDLEILLRDVHVALVGGDAEAGEELLREDHLEVRVERRIDGFVRAVIGVALPFVIDGQARSHGKVLGVVCQSFDGVLLKGEDAIAKCVVLLGDVVIVEALEVHEGVEGGDGGAGAKRRGDDAARAGSRRSRAGVAGAGAAAGEAALGGRLHDCGIDAIHAAARPGARVVGFGDGEVIAEVGEIEVVFDRQSDGIVQRNVQLAVADQVLKARRIREVERRRLAGPVGRERIVRVRKVHVKGTLRNDGRQTRLLVLLGQSGRRRSSAAGRRRRGLRSGLRRLRVCRRGLRLRRRGGNGQARGEKQHRGDALKKQNGRFGSAGVHGCLSR